MAPPCPLQAERLNPRRDVPSLPYLASLPFDVPRPFLHYCPCPHISLPSFFFLSPTSRIQSAPGLSLPTACSTRRAFSSSWVFTAHARLLTLQPIPALLHPSPARRYMFP